MDREEFIEVLLDYYEHPRNRGPLSGAQLHASGGNPGCGDLVTMYARVDDSGHLTELSFEGEGCTISQAAASMLTEMAQGKSLAELEAMSYEEMIDLLGREVVSVRPRCATLGLSILKNAARDYEQQQTREAAGRALGG
ncbi:MAG TPA: iron-sulfur cluster assembly scaffold protein [Chloroflexota bacterium]|nr:iron-sulfur cluster assembly scaffold protein [Chloroflexota bacterium]